MHKGFTRLIIKTKQWTVMWTSNKSKKGEYSIMEKKMGEVKYVRMRRAEENNKGNLLSKSLLGRLPQASYNIVTQHPQNLSLSNCL